MPKNSLSQLAWHALSSSTHEDKHTTLHHVLQWILAASDTHLDVSTLLTHYTSYAAFCKLLLLMDPMLLHPPQPTESPNFNTAVGDRLHLFCQGKVKTIYLQMLAIPHQPSNGSPVTFSSDNDPCLQAQNPINLDNYCTQAITTSNLIYLLPK
jgi:hypothetical protein